MRFTIFNQKGGTGKTTVAIHLARMLGPNTLLIDLDPQATATNLVGLDEVDEGIYDALEGTASLSDIVLESPWGFSVAPATTKLALFERERMEKQESRIAQVLDNTVYPAFEHIVIDSPPGVGYLAQNALVASDRAVIVTEPNYPAMLGLAEAIDSIRVIGGDYNPKLEFSGVVVNKVLATSESRYRIAELTELIGAEKILCRIPQRAAIAEAAGELRPCTHPALTGQINELKERLING